MADFDQRIRDTLGQLEERPDPARIMERVGGRKKHLRRVHRVQTVALVVAVLAGVGGGMFALGRAFGVGTVRPIGSPTPSSAPSQPTPTPTIAFCSGETAALSVRSQEGAAGTIRTLWQVATTGSAPCRSEGYPGMAFHTSNGWVDVRAHRGGFADISQSPTAVEVPPGGSMYFVTYWGDVTSGAGPCRSFDRVRVTLPGDRVPVEVATSGCLDPTSVRAGPVTRTRPS